MLEKLSKIDIKKLIVIGIISVIVIALIIIITAPSSKEEGIEEVNKKTTGIVFENNSYTCEEGQEIYVMIKPSKNDFPSDIYITSNDTNIAMVNNNAGILCDNCKKVAVECKKSGTTTLNAVYNKETLASVNINVKEVKKEVIAFEKKLYSCYYMETFETYVKVNDTQSANSITKISSSDKNYVDVSEISTESSHNYKKIRVRCVGNSAKLKAETTNGDIAEAQVNVITHGQKPVSFVSILDGGSGNYAGTEYSYTCNRRTQSIHKIALNDNNNKIKRVYSEDTSMAEIKLLEYTRNDNLMDFELLCRDKPGVTRLYAEDINGFTTYVYIYIDDKTPPTGPPKGSDSTPKK